MPTISTCSPPRATPCLLQLYSALRTLLSTCWSSSSAPPTSMNVRIEASWRRGLAAEFDKLYFGILTDRIRSEYQSGRAAAHPQGRSSAPSTSAPSIGYASSS